MAQGKIFEVVPDDEIVKAISEIQNNWSGYNQTEHPEEKISVWSRGLLNSLRNRYNVRITRKEATRPTVRKGEKWGVYG